MLKIRTFLFALLGVSPLLFLSWQLPNQAKVLSTNNNESATLSGYPTPIAQSSPPSTFAPSKGPAGTPSGGAITGSNGNVFSLPVINTAAPVGASPSVTVSVDANGDVRITVTPAATVQLNVAAANILTDAAAAIGAAGGAAAGGGDAGGGQGVATVVALAVDGPQAQAAVAQLTSVLSAAGASPTLVANLLQNIAGLFSSTAVSTTPSFPSAKLPQAQLVAGTKDLKASLTIAQTNTAPTVNINKLNNAINAYNQIVLESSPVVLQKLAQDKDFLAIGQTLKTLRAAIQ